MSNLMDIISYQVDVDIRQILLILAEVLLYCNNTYNASNVGKIWINSSFTVYTPTDKVIPLCLY